MLCAKELIAIADANAARIAAEKAKAAEREAIAAKENAAKLAEEIMEKFMADAINGIKPCWFVKYHLAYDTGYLFPLIDEGRKYANKEHSYRQDHRHPIDFNEVSRRLSPLCFEVRAVEDSYKEYGFGRNPACWLSISPAPQC